MYRLVTGRVAKTDDRPWVNATVIFQRTKGNFTFTNQYPPDVIRAKTDNLGNLFYVNSSGVTFQGVPLWVNETGDLITNYDCILPKDSFKFSLPVGDGSPIELSTLRSGSQPTESYPQSLVNYIDTQTTVNSETLTIADNIIVLNSNVSTGTPTEDLGIEGLRGVLPTASLKFVESTDRWNAGIVGNELPICRVFETTFTNATLVAGILTVTHNLGRQICQVIIADNTNKAIGAPDEIVYTSSSTLSVDMVSFGALTGTWTINVRG